MKKSVFILTVLALLSFLSFSFNVLAQENQQPPPPVEDTNPPPPDDTATPEPLPPLPGQKATQLEQKYQVDPSVIQTLRNKQMGYGEIDHTLSLAQQMPNGITEDNVQKILDLRQGQKKGWGQVARELGLKMGNSKETLAPENGVNSQRIQQRTNQKINRVERPRHERPASRPAHIQHGRPSHK